MWISNLDVYALANVHNAFDTTLSGIRVDDGILDLYFSAINYGAGYEYAGPFLNGLEIHLLEELSVKNIEPTEFFISSPFPNPIDNSHWIKKGITPCS